MCGIAGYVGTEKAAPILVRALKRLEYRGYDSAGVATIYSGEILVRKDVGRVDEINSRLNIESMPGKIGIAHTRWATHGAPTSYNAHPHTDCSKTIAIVHNGVIENYMSLKRELMDLNHNFASRTDSEIIAHLIEEHLRRGEQPEQAIRKTLQELEGSFAIAIILTRCPSTLFAARREAPLHIGVGQGFNMVASDITALIDMTRDLIFLHDGDMAILTDNSYTISRIETGEVVERRIKKVDLTIEMAERGGYPHFMLKEIFEQPETLRSSLRLQIEYVDLVGELLEKGRIVYLLGAGTSYNACVAGSYLFSQIARFPTYPVIASEFVPNYGSSIGGDTVILAVSQSGETADVLNALEFARMRACTILGITNTVGSTLTRISRAYVLQNAGPEMGVAATKTFTSQVLVLAKIAVRLARLRGKIAQYEIDEFNYWLERVPIIVADTLRAVGEPIKQLAEKLATSRVTFILGRGVSYSTALEGRLKIMELSYIPCIAYPAGESKHGPISVIEAGVPVIFVVPPDEHRKLNVSSIMEMKARGAYTAVIGDSSDQELKQLADHYIEMPKTHPLLSPITYAIPLQLLAYHTAVKLGYDPDKPRNLAKSITVL
ncbi:MAG: glutamine--fructose-6-phosphate transaminase (isomerizing) [Nitrososphaerota archaeon]|nr:glutamine--fructose-6-phosphate transaminase (isomerizing) [Nitrososphaerota archaeon]